MTELEKVLRVIREECKSRDNCKECPLRKCGGGCAVSYGTNPENWQLKGDEIDNRLFV